jgi:CHASE2 domain-containing sensor protein
VNLKSALVENWRVGMFGALSSIFLGLIFLMRPLGLGLRNLSYDIPFFFRPDIKPTEAIVVYMDPESYDRLGQQPLQEWHRVLHAELLKQLDRRGAKAVVFDVLIDEPWTNKTLSLGSLHVLTNVFGYATDDVIGPKVDQIFTQAVHQAQCKVIFGALWERQVDPFERKRLKAPDQIIGSNTLFGLIEFPLGTGLVVRQHNWDENPPGLGWSVANLLGRAPPDPARLRWINYYGPPGTIRSIPYYKVFESEGAAQDLFSGKIVFVGKQQTLTGGGHTVTDEWPTPYTWWKGARTPGVEIQATAFLNFYREEWLRQLSAWTETFLLLITGCLFGYGLTYFRPWVATRVALLSSLLIMLGAFWLVWTTHYWISWVIVVGVQIPVTLVWSVITTTKRLYREKAVLEESLATARSAGLTPVLNAGAETQTKAILPLAGPLAAPLAQAGMPPRPGETVPPGIPDHTLLKCIGKGAYGEVWLAQDIIGSYHAVKVVYRRSFSSDSPYLREFRGIQKFTPVSRSHPGLVQILHVGRNDQGGYFYCIMEAGDDEKTGQQIDPTTYLPRNLARELDARGRLPVRECVALGLALSSALQFLHERKLIHRDIKPSNIIFVQNSPKFADIGLVTDLASPDKDVSFLGTEGFMAPEGPGTAAADVYSLGKLLYEAGMGRDRQQFPELPTKLDEWPDQEQLLKLNSILLKACETDVTNRYQSAAEMHNDLLAVQIRISAI